MKKFSTAAFHITLFQVLLVLSMSGLKYWMSSSGLGESFRLPLVVIGIGAFVALLTALGISGHLEKQGYTVERWMAARPTSKMRVWTAQFVQWGQVLPIVVGYSFCLYVIMPTSLTLFLAFFVGIIIRNIIEYVTRKKDAPSDVSS